MNVAQSVILVGACLVSQTVSVGSTKLPLSKYSNYQIIRVLGDESRTPHNIPSENQLATSGRIQFMNECGSLIEVWDEDKDMLQLPDVTVAAASFTFHVSPDHAESVQRSLQQHGIKFKIISRDMSLMLWQQITGSMDNNFSARDTALRDDLIRLGGKRMMMTSAASGKDAGRRIPAATSHAAVDPDFFTMYHKLDEIHAYLKKLSVSHPQVDLKVIGKTYEGREILALEISNDRSSVSHASMNKLSPVFLIECGIHAREWISPAACLWIIDQILHPLHRDLTPSDAPREEDDEASNSIISSFNGSFIIIPVMNPDGYEYTWTEERMWRKNKSPNRFFRRCHGVDLNRNFDIKFKPGSELFDSCKHTYPGISPFSELETISLRDYLLSLKEKGIEIKSYISVHSFSQLWMYPYGYTKEKCEDDAELSKLSKDIVYAMSKVNGTHYKPGSIFKTIYGKATYGSTIDYTYDKFGIKYSFAVELRDQGDEGFLLHPRFIVPTAKELWLAVETIVSAIITTS